MVVAFCLLWIPYVDLLGGLIAIFGIAYLYFGGRALDESFHRGVVRGALLIIAGFVVTVISTLVYLEEITNTARTPGETIPQFLSSLQPDLEAFVVGALLAAVLVSLGYVFLPYGGADEVSRVVLWGAFALTFGVATIGLVILWPQIVPALNSAVNGGSINLAPIQALQLEAQELGLLQAVPDLMFAYAYYRIRSRLLSGEDSPTAPPSSSFGRTSG